MKKLVLLLTVAAVSVAVFIVSCVCNDSGRQTEIADADKAGIVHNQALDSVLNDLWAARIDDFLNHGETRSPRTRSSGGMEQLEDRAYATGLQALKDIDPELPVDRAMAEFPKGKVLASAVKLEAGDFSEVEVLGGFTLKYYKKISALLKSRTPFDNFMKEMLFIEEEIRREAPTRQEADLMLTLTSIAKHSADYWYHNLKEWRAATGAEVVRIAISQEFPVLTRDGIIDRMPSGYYPYPGDLTQFIYVTEDGTMIVLKCPDGLHYNAKTCTCDYPHNVDEGGGDSGDTNWWNIAEADLNGGLSGGGAGSVSGGFGLGTVVGAVVGAAAASILNGIGQ